MPFADNLFAIAPALPRLSDASAMPGCAWAWFRLAITTPSAWLCVLSLTALWQSLYSNRRWPGIVALCVWLVLALLPVGDWALAPLEAPYPRQADLPQAVDGIVVLGGAEKTLLSAVHAAPVLQGGAGRVLTAAALALRYPKARLVFTGGHSALTATAPLTEADVAARIFASLGITGARILYESRSTDTWENAAFAMATAHPAPGEHWVLVTSAWHMSRALLAFEAQGWAVIPYPTDWQSDPRNFRPLLGFADSMAKLDRAVHEYIGLIAYSLHPLRELASAEETQKVAPLGARK